MEKQYQHLKGMEKCKIKERLGQEFNYYAYDIWTYLLKTTWYGRKTFLNIIFKNDVVIDIRIKNEFRFNGL